MPPSRARLGRIGALALASALLVTPAAPALAAGDAPSATEDVQAATSSITLSSTSLTVGETLTVDYATDAPHEKNWIGVYAAGQTPGGPASTVWDYTPGASGSVDFVADLAAGTWVVWFLAEDGYEPLADPIEFEVIAPEGVPQPGDPSAPVEIDPVQTGVETDETISRTPFGADGAEGWTTSVGDDTADGAGAYRGWQFTDRAEWTADVDEMRLRFGRTAGSFAVADAQQFGGALSTTLTGRAVAVSGLGSVELGFDSHYRGAPGQSGVVTASFDGGEPVEVLRLDSTTVEDGYDPLQTNGHHDVVVAVPEGAEEVVFSWEFRAEEDGRYWAIDEVAVRQVLTAPGGDPTQAWVMSDIQGHPQDWQHAIGDYTELAPDADSMVIVGDIVNSGLESEWDEIYDVMDATEDVRPPQTIATIGNHERYALGGFEANRDRFLDFAERDRVWDEYVIDGPSGGLPVIALGQEFGGPTDVPMSDEQVEFLEERLAYWTAQDKQVMVLTHFPLGDTVSASWIPWYHDHHMMNDRLTSILGNYPNAVVFSGHTHYPGDLGDWAVQRRTDDGHADGFWAVNTLAMHVGWDAVGEDTDGISETTIGDVNGGLTVDAYADRMVVRSYDFAADEQLRELTIPNPLVASETDAAPLPEDPDEENPGEEPDEETPGEVPDEENPGEVPDDGQGEGPGAGEPGERTDETEPTGSNPAGSDPAASPDGELAVTGSDANAVALWAALGTLLAAGGTALVIHRRSRRA